MPSARRPSFFSGIPCWACTFRNSALRCPRLLCAVCSKPLFLVASLHCSAVLGSCFLPLGAAVAGAPVCPSVRCRLRFAIFVKWMCWNRVFAVQPWAVRNRNSPCTSDHRTVVPAPHRNRPHEPYTFPGSDLNDTQQSCCVPLRLIVGRCF